MKKLSEMNLNELLAYYHHIERYGKAPNSDAELELAILADNTFTQLYIASQGQVSWNENEERFVAY